MNWLMTMNLTIKQSNSFKKAVKKLPKQHKAIVDEEVRKLVNNPYLGERKKGDFDFLMVHKFKLLSQEVLLGYMYNEDKIILTLLKLGNHENFYRDIRNIVTAIACYCLTTSTPLGGLKLNIFTGNEGFRCISVKLTRVRWPN